MPSSDSMFDNEPNMERRVQDMLNSRFEDTHIWDNLKAAIAASSGFRRWRVERKLDEQLSGLGLDHLVHRYLRETLETLAY